MYARCLAAMAVLTLSLSVAFTGDAKPDDAKNIQGTWKVVSFKGSNESPSEEELSKVRVRIKDDQLIFVVNGSDSEGALKFRLDTAKKLKEFDFIFVIRASAKSKGSEPLHPGIYELNGDELKICWRLVKPIATKDKDKKTEMAVRPKEFKSDDNHTLLILKRDK